jgi:hypothetical protein
MKLKKIATRIRNDIQHYGLVKTAYEMLIEAINLVVDFRITKAMKIEEVNPALLDCDEPLEWRFLEAGHLLELATDPDNKMEESFVRAALDKGDECYGALDGEVLACYGWYSNKPTDDYDLMVHFSPEYMYMYAGYTNPRYRGKRLHGIGMNRALRAYLGRGFKGLVSTVTSHNAGSLKSVYRLGYRDIGNITVLKMGRRAWIHSSRGCRQAGFSLALPPTDPKTTHQRRGQPIEPAQSRVG